MMTRIRKPSEGYTLLIGTPLHENPPDSRSNSAVEGASPAEPVDPEQRVDASPTVAIFDLEHLCKQLRLGRTVEAIGDDDIVMSVPTSSPEEQARLERLRALAGETADCRLLVASAAMPAALALLRNECPAFVPVIDLVDRAVAVSRVAHTGINFPPVLLVGPPGLGKTHFSNRLAAALGAEQHAFACSTNSDAQALVIGHPPTWKGARMGVLTEAMLGGKTANPLIVLDEIDKFVSHAAERPYNSLLGLLEPENAAALVDEYLRIPFDLSHALIIATANDLEALPDFIRDRFLIIEVKAPTGDMLRAIARRIAFSVLAEHGHVFDRPDAAVIAKLAQANPRTIRRLFALALGFAAAAGRRHLIAADIDAASSLAATAASHRAIGFLAGARNSQAT